MKRTDFNLLFSLQKDHPWLKGKGEELKTLLFHECRTSKQLNLMVEILRNFTYLSNEEFSTKITKMVDSLNNNYCNNSDVNIVTATAPDIDSDSSQELLYRIKSSSRVPLLEEYALASRYDQFIKKINPGSNINIALVDDFSGTGQTIIQRVKTLTTRLGQKNITAIIKVYLITCTRHARLNIEQKNIHVTTQVEIEKVIDKISLTKDDLASNMTLMKELESNLATVDKYNSPLPSLGYGGAQVAFCREDANTPNNVLPVFWWNLYSTLTERKPLLNRRQGQTL